MPNTLLEKILAPGAISTVFQPIYKVEAKVAVPVIIECLSRGPASTNAAHAGVLFEYAQLKGAEQLVDRACISAALQTVATFAHPRRFSLSIFGATLVRDDGFVSWMADLLNRLRIDPSNLVFELVEHGEAWDAQVLLRSLRDIRALGSSIALDDVGLAHSNLKRILDCEPEFLKLDRCLVHNCDSDRRRQALLRSMELLANDLELSLIAEGVETREELEEVESHQIRLFQGFYFSKPLPACEIAGLLEVRNLRRPTISVPVHVENEALETL